MLDDIDLEADTMRGVEKIHRRILRNLIIRRSISSTFSLILFALGAYFKLTRQVNNEVLVVMIPFMVDGVVVFGYSGYNLYTKGKILLCILKKIVSAGRSQINSNSRRETLQDVKLVKAYDKFRYVIPTVVVCLIVEGSFMFVFGLWAIFTLNSIEGMAWITLFLAIIEVLCIPPTFVLINYMFIIW